MISPCRAIALGVVTACNGCFVYAPASITPQPGAQVALVLTDEGQAALTATVGPGVHRVEGVLAAIENGEYLLDGPWVTLARGNQIPVAGTRMRVSQGYVAQLEERRFSPGRSYPVLGGALVLVASFFITRGFAGRGTPPETPGEPPAPNNSLRAR